MKVTRIIEIQGEKGWVLSTLASSLVTPQRDFNMPSGGRIREIARIEGGAQVAVVVSKVDQS